MIIPEAGSLLDCFSFRKRFEQQQKLLEEERKRRQFEEQKQKLRLLSSVKPKVTYSGTQPTPLNVPILSHLVDFVTWAPAQAEAVVDLFWFCLSPKAKDFSFSVKLLYC